MAKRKLSPLQEAYQRFFREKLRKYGVDSQAKLSKENKIKFFNEVQKDWQPRRRRIKDKEQLKHSRYTNQYLRNVTRRFNISKYKIEAGMLLELRYKALNEDTGKLYPPAKYFVLILHPNYKKYTHALRLDFVPPRWTRKLVESVGLKPATALKQHEKLNIRQMALEEGNSRRFYYKELKPHMDNRYKNSYRTFRLDRFSIVNVYNFNWEKL